MTLCGSSSLITSPWILLLAEFVLHSNLAAFYRQVFEHLFSSATR